jgi:hypothetical protein
VSGNEEADGGPMTPPAQCPFCFPAEDRVAFEDRLTRALWDSFPVREGHLLLATQCTLESSSIPYGVSKTSISALTRASRPRDSGRDTRKASASCADPFIRLTSTSGF